MASLEELKYFLSVAKTSNVSRAAELMGISQPALSHALKRLEDELGVRLLNREKTGVRLTRAGERFASQSRELLEKWEQLSTSVKTSDETISGHFKIGCHPSVAIYSLPKFLKQLQTAYNDLHFSLYHGLSREVASEVIQWKLDFGLVINPPAHLDLVIKDLGQDEVTLFIHKDLKDSDTLICEPSLLQTQDILAQLNKRKMSFPKRIESGNLEVIRALTIAGCGVGILPTRVANSSQDKELRPYSSKSPVFKDRLCLIYRAGTQNHAAGRVIVDAILKAEI